MRTILLLSCLAACASDADVAGDYTIAITNRDNGCGFANWTVGASTTAAVTLTQSGGSVTASVSGVGAVVLDLVLGGHAYTGSVSGSAVSLTLVGSRSGTMGNCAFTYTSRIAASANGDSLSGSIDYQPVTNGNPDCAPITGCRTFQDFNGTRPPR
jgi:hypothetical protein